MALDGITVACLCSELKQKIEGGKISKIAMPEKEELLITIKNNSENHRLLLSVGSSIPLVYLTDSNKKAPLVAPGFCMLLRKHIGNARILRIAQDGLERIIRFEFEHQNELGDLCRKFLYIELMGKYSNIIFTDDKDVILDSIRRVPSQVSSLREVLPGRPYYLPDKLKKLDPLSMSIEDFKKTFIAENTTTDKALYTSLSGISPLVAADICFLAGADPDGSNTDITDTEVESLFKSINLVMDNIRREKFTPTMILLGETPYDFCCLPISSYNSQRYTLKHYDSVSRLLEDFYSLKARTALLRQKSSDLRKLVSTAIERNSRKFDLQSRRLKDTEKKDKYKVFGDLLNTYGYELKGGEKELVCQNFYDENKQICVPLDVNLSASQNAKKYYDRYSKLRRTRDAVGLEIKRTGAHLKHLESILTSLDLVTEENDLNQIREELMDFGYIKRRLSNSRKPEKKKNGEPLHYISSEGYDIYVGKNNYQNDELTFKIASSSDWWFHAKGIPGSHVIVKSQGRQPGDKTFEEAAGLAAYYSKNRNDSKVEIDYIQRKSLKKVTGAAPGFVIYHTNWSMMASPNADLQTV